MTQGDEGNFVSEAPTPDNTREQETKVGAAWHSKPDPM